MLRLRIAVMASVVAALAIAPGIASATVTQSEITSPADGAYLQSSDNLPNPTTLFVSGTATGASIGDLVDIVCYYGASPSHYELLTTTTTPLLVGHAGAFSTPTGAQAPPLSRIAGHACRLRAIPAGEESKSDTGSFAGPHIAVSEAGLPSAEITDGPNSGHNYNFYVNGTTFTGTAGWGAAGACGPFAAPLDQSFGIGNFAINCAGSLLGDNLPVGASRSEVQVDGQNAYDAASAQSLFPRTNGLENGSEDLPGFPSLGASAKWSPANGLVSSQSTESWVVCQGGVAYPPTILTCPSFAGAGVTLQRNVTMNEGGQVVTMTDTWSSADGAAHNLDLLYDDRVGLDTSSAERGYELPGQSGFTPYSAGETISGPSAAPGSVLVRTNLGAPDGDSSEGVGAITFSNAPSDFVFAGNNELEEHDVLHVPASGSTSLSYIYSVGYTVADVEAEALAAQDRIEGPALAIASPASGATVSSPAVTLAGTATSGSGIASLLVNGLPVPVGSGGGWSSQVALSPGANTINAVMVDGAGEVSDAQISVTYQPPAGMAPAPICKVPKTKGMKLPAAEKAVRRADCKVGGIKKVRSRSVRGGRVAGTSPPAGRKLRAGWRVELFVSKASGG